MRPPGPVPAKEARSIPSSAASFLATGETCTRPASGAVTEGRAGGTGATGLAGAASLGTSSWSRGRCGLSGLAFLADDGQNRSDRDLFSRLDEDFFDDTGGEDFYLNIRFVRLDVGDDVAALTLSPTFLRQPKSLPALMSAPSCGMTNSAMARDHLPGRGDDFLNFRQSRRLEMLRVRHGHFRAAHARHGRVEIIEGILHDLGADFGGEASRAPSLHR